MGPWLGRERLLFPPVAQVEPFEELAKALECLRASVQSRQLKSELGRVEWFFCYSMKLWLKQPLELGGSDFLLLAVVDVDVWGEDR